MGDLQRGDPRRLGDYRLVRRLGSGGMGIVYLARSPGGRLVAVKVVRPRFALRPSYRARFRREVAAARRVTGAFTAPLLDADPDAEAPWLATRYLPGPTLHEAVTRFGALPADAVRLLAAALAEALADIHRAQLVHRDLKPGNVLLTPEGPRVIDFGIARPEDSPTVTQPGSLIGTPGFMSPEQALGRRAGPPADVFALGAVLAFAATGRRPFDAPDTAETLDLVERARVDLGGVTDRALRAAIAACLRRDPARRPTAAALLRRLGEPSASVHGTRWLPAALATEIEHRSARPPRPREAERGAGAAEGEGAEVPAAGIAAAETDEPAPSAPTPSLQPSCDAPPAPPPPTAPRRRGVLRALAAAVPVTAVGIAAATLAWGSDDTAPPDDETPTGRSQAPPTDPPPPPEGTRRWRARVGDYYVRLHTADGAVVATSDHDDRTLALDPRTGTRLWTRPDSACLAASTDAVFLDGGTGSSTLVALATPSGTPRWTSGSSDFVFLTQAAVTSATVFCHGYVVPPFGDTTVTKLIRAFDPADGGTRWSAEVEADRGLAAGHGFVAAAGTEALTALDAGSGRIRWRHPAELINPLVADGVVIASSLRAGALYAFRAGDGAPAWGMQLSTLGAGIRLHHGVLYLAEVGGEVVALAPDSGEPLWSRQLGNGEGADYAESHRLVLADGPDGLSTLYIAGTDGVVRALDPADGRVLWTYPTGDPSAKVTATAGLAFVSTQDGHLTALAPPDSDSDSDSDGASRGTV
ncbi:PQQ-binding-like beta-propeller repeat protein [Streptomyces sp. B6B3]|uniref:protein kinase domain-containing protein n=1 Tax=Streptomyces sp. B6B3 TaxID=3153570 RepID=UPI00325CFD58